jgi:hypothetical protein
MASTVVQKLKIKEGNVIRVLNTPEDYKKSLSTLPAGAEITAAGNNVNQLHWFVKNKGQMEKELKKVLPLIKGDTICWIFYPKGTSKIQTDLSRDSVWSIMQDQKVQMISLICFDDTWSAFGMRQKNEVDRKKNKQPKERPIFDYVDPKTKTVKLPADFAAGLKKNKKQQAFFNSLSFTNKKEYIEWIVTAKREETRNERLKASIERLGKEWKNPANR